MNSSFLFKKALFISDKKMHGSLLNTIKKGNKSRGLFRVKIIS
jgi:hypothetical protein